MACTFPQARNVQEYWQNIVDGKDCVHNVDPQRWDPDVFFSDDPHLDDRVYCKRGGFLGTSFAFEPVRYGAMPSAIPGAEPDQFLVLRTAYEAIADAGFDMRDIGNKRGSLILGRGSYLGAGATSLLMRGVITEQTLGILKKLHPEYTADQLQSIKDELRRELPPFAPDTAPGLIPNITTGRVANRLDFMEATYTVDAACASSLIATENAMRGLLSHQYDIALTGGVHIFSDFPFLQVFARMGALSRSSTIRPFDERSDGTLAGEGCGIMVLKRLEDAQRHGDRIYAIIRGVGTSSDGRATSITAPRIEGEELALRRAYEMSHVDPRTISLIEGHGTGTPVGDAAEIDALHRVLGHRELGELRDCALGSVKSMIGHTMPAAGIASLIKTALAIYHRVLPPTLHCEQPVEAVSNSSSRFYMSTEKRPWFRQTAAVPRRAGVSAFGFGGVNAHVVLEEAPMAIGPIALQTTPTTTSQSDRISYIHRWDSEVCILEADSRQDMVGVLKALGVYLNNLHGVELKDIAYSLHARLSDKAYRLGIVALTLEDLSSKVARALERLGGGQCTNIKDRSGIYYSEDAEVCGGKLAFVFPGEGSQYLNMLRDLCIHFPIVRECFEMADHAVHETGRAPMSSVVFPATGRSEAEQESAEKALWSIERATETVMTADLALYQLIQKLGITPDVIAGHSGGDWIGLVASGMVSLSDFIESMPRLEAAYRGVSSHGNMRRVVMFAVGASRQRVETLLMDHALNADIANDNCPHQIVVVTEPDHAEKFQDLMRTAGILTERLPYDRGYHTPAFTCMREPLNTYFSSLTFRSPTVPVYNSTTAAHYPSNTADILDILANTFVQPLRFTETIQSLYDDGVRSFLEIGPKGNLIGFISDTLRGRPHLAVAVDQSRRTGVTALHHALAALAAIGVGMDLSYLYERRQPKQLSFDAEEDSIRNEMDRPGAMSVSICYPRLHIGQDFALPPKHAEVKPNASSLPKESEPFARNVSPSLAKDAERAKQAPVAADSRFQAVTDHMRLMEQIVDTQSEILAVQLSTEAPLVTEEKPVPNLDRLPMLHGELVEFVAGKRIVIRQNISLENDAYLVDHAFDVDVSADDPHRSHLHVVPLTVSVELMAEAASLLNPNLRIVEIKHLRADSWLELSGKRPEVSVLIEAETTTESSNVVHTKILRIEQNQADSEIQIQTVAHAQMILGKDWAAAPKPTAISLSDAVQPKMTAKQMYAQKHMFHGHTFQRVTSLDEIGQNGLIATVRCSPAACNKAATTDSGFILDPFLLDSIGQLVGYWPVEFLNEGFVVFPVAIESICLYGPHPKPEVCLRTALKVKDVSYRQIQADMEVTTPSGEVWMRIDGWQDRRFYWPRTHYNFWRFPKEFFASRKVQPSSPIPDFDGVVYQMEWKGELENKFWQVLWAHLICSQVELDEFWSIESASRREEWLCARTAVKDAVRAYIQNQIGWKVFPADVCIVHDKQGRPSAIGSWASQLDTPVHISISHKKGLAIGAASGQAIGVDLELIKDRPSGFDAIAFNETEQRIISQMHGCDQQERVTRAFSAKEAAGKAIGLALLGELNAVRLDNVDEASRFQVQIKRSNEQAAQVNKSVMVNAATWSTNGYIYSIALEEKITHAP